jgi:hypothetical protein
MAEEAEAGGVLMASHLHPWLSIIVFEQLIGRRLGPFFVYLYTLVVKICHSKGKYATNQGGPAATLQCLSEQPGTVVRRLFWAFFP